MNFFQRAIKSTQRRLGKSLLLFTLVFILGTIITGANAVDIAINNTEENLRTQMRPLISFEMDSTALMNDDGIFDIAEPITVDIARRIEELPQVRQHHYMVGTHIQTHQLMNYFIGGEQHFDDDFPNQFDVQGGSTEIPLQFAENILNLVSGSYFSNETLGGGYKPIIISQELAEINNLILGSIIDLELVVLRPQPSELGIGSWEENWHLNPENVYATELFQLEIIGLFELPIEEYSEELSVVSVGNRQRERLLNTIFTTNNTAESIQNFQMYNFVSVWSVALAEIGMTIDDFFGRDLLETSFESVMELYDARDVDDFRAVAYQLLPEYWTIIDLSNSFESISSSMDMLQDIGRWILLSAIIATILILSLLITLYLRDRRGEIGVYTALGEKKIKIVSQLLIEIMIVAMIGVSFAIFTGTFLSENMSRFMLQNQLIAEQTTDNHFVVNLNMLERFGFNQEMSVDEMLESFEISLSLETIGLFFATGIIVVVFSTLVPVTYVLSLNPKKILMEN